MSMAVLPQPRLVRAEARVLAALDLTPRMRRLTFGGSALGPLLDADAGAAAASWVKVFVPGRAGRAYTIGHIDRVTGRLDIDFVLHSGDLDDGSVSAWARSARPGAVVGMAGPRAGGFTLLPDTRWVWLAGDASALPALQSILARLPSGMHAHVHIAVEDERERQPLATPALLHETWHYATRPGEPRRAHPTGEAQDLRHGGEPGQVWIAGEASAVKAMRTRWLDEQGMEPRRVNSKGYWKLGERDHRDPVQTD